MPGAGSSGSPAAALESQVQAPPPWRSPELRHRGLKAAPSSGAGNWVPLPTTFWWICSRASQNRGAHHACTGYFMIKDLIEETRTGRHGVAGRAVGRLRVPSWAAVHKFSWLYLRPRCAGTVMRSRLLAFSPWPCPVQEGSWKGQPSTWALFSAVFRAASSFAQTH